MANTQKDGVISTTTIVGGGVEGPVFGTLSSLYRRTVDGVKHYEVWAGGQDASGADDQLLLALTSEDEAEAYRQGFNLGRSWVLTKDWEKTTREQQIEKYYASDIQEDAAAAAFAAPVSAAGTKKPVDLYDGKLHEIPITPEQSEELEKVLSLPLEQQGEAASRILNLQKPEKPS
jgi:hypothetical protein